jgi:hypothetical protein
MAAIILPKRDSELQANLIWCACGQRSIPRPPGATPRTKYTCPTCCQEEWKKRMERDNGMRALLEKALCHLSTAR